ncbi:MAG: hypothetical protein ACM3ZE_13185, partial [Myxococcales bacterium]
MTSAHLRYNPSDEPLWLVVQRGDRTQSFEFPPHAHKAIVVGSGDNSDLRIREAEPVACFLEREGSSICLTPARPDAEIRVDTLKIEGRRRIYTYALLQIANVQLRLKVRDTPPTLRADGVTQESSESSEALSKRPAATDDMTATTTIDSSAVMEALGQRTTGSLPRLRPIPVAALATKTIEVDAFNPDGWFGEGVKEGTLASDATQVLEPEPVFAPITSNSTSNWVSMPTVTAARPPRRQSGPPNIKTQEMAPLTWPSERVTMEQSRAITTDHRALVDASPSRSHEVGPIPERTASSLKTARPGSTSEPLQASNVDGDAAASESSGTAKGPDHRIAPSTKSEVRIDPYRTIEIAPIRLADPVATNPAGRAKLETRRQTTTLQVGRGGQASETTDLEVPVVNLSIEQRGTGLSSAAPCAERTPAREALSPIHVSARAMAPAASIGSDPWFLEGDSERPVSSPSPAKVGRWLPSFSIGLERLGLLAKRRPTIVFVGAAFGSLVLVLFFAGLARLMSPQSDQKPQRVTAVQRAAPQRGISAEASKAAGAESYATGIPPSSRPDAAHPLTPAQTRHEDVPAAIAAVANATPAVGHLFAGRLPEAAQAYYELAQKFPDEPVFQSASRILARKNSPACRGTNSSKTACPSVKP